MSYKVPSVQWVNIKSLFRRSLIRNLKEPFLSVLNKVTLSDTGEKILERITAFHITTFLCVFLPKG